MRVKICGITKPAQADEIARMGATAIGFICVPSSPRFVTPDQIRAARDRLSVKIDTIGVFANTSSEEIYQIVAATGLNAVQLHASESPEFCDRLRQLLPNIELIKALRIRTSESLTQANAYSRVVDTLLLDAYHPTNLGGTGQTLDWHSLQTFSPSLPWFLAGGLTPENISDALTEISPNGIDLSSGVERSPGDKDLDKVAKLFDKLAHLTKKSPLLVTET